MILMPLAFSISTALTFGVLSYILISVGAGKAKNISVVMWIVGALCLFNLILAGH
jgi:AGZA family xanthine/uracil permease-like MFS transporter